ncbi:MAG: hypothetical protein ILA03_06115 [Bacteroidaceae bacterium]|nr:hypothetical protein [Bacteroidaceae bacterium]MBQ9675660.1 hypothetical protein [Bacteroidaceae bacterium]
MKIISKEQFDEYLNAEVPNPQSFKTIDVIESNDCISLIKKEDGTFALRDETTGKENGSFLTKEEAVNFYKDLISEK